jgi:hypothetical protein
MNYEIVTTDMGEQAIKATDSSGKVWWIPQDPENSMYQEYLDSISE